jgi:hypothetical protein
MSFICALVLGAMDKRAEKLLKKASTETGDVVSGINLTKG